MVDSKKLREKWDINPFQSLRDNKEIYFSFFEDYKDTVEVMDDLVNKGIYSRGKNPSSKVIPIINICFNYWKERCMDFGFEEREKIIKVKLGKRTFYYKGYRTNLNLFFKEYEKVRKLRIPTETKRFIELCFEIKDIRKALYTLSKSEDLLSSFEKIVKFILYFLIRETPKYKEQSPYDSFKRKRFVYDMALPKIRTRINSYFKLKKEDNQITCNIIRELDIIFKDFNSLEEKLKSDYEKGIIKEKPFGFMEQKGELIRPWNFFNMEKEEEYVYIFHECDFKNLDILISLLKIFGDELSKMFFKQSLIKKSEDISNELIKDHGNDLIKNEVRKDEVIPLRTFMIRNIKHKFMLNSKEFDEAIKEIEKMSNYSFENFKRLYVKLKINKLLRLDTFIHYTLNKLESNNLKDERRRRFSVNSLYPTTEKEYCNRWNKLLETITQKDIATSIKF